MAGGSLAERHDGHQRGDARTGHPDPIALDRTIEIATATMLLEEGVEVSE
jgi:hypothetical protein